MRDKPSGRDLLDAARKVLREELASALDGEARYKALMVANAIAIASRQMAKRPLGSGLDLARLKMSLRAGELDPGTHADLLVLTRAKLAESNPRYPTDT